MFFVLVLVAVPASCGQSNDESIVADQDASFQKLAEAYHGLIDLNRELDARHVPRPSLRHHHSALALARHSHHHRGAPIDDKELKEKETKVAAVSNDLKETVDEAIHHVKDGVVLKHDIAQKGVKLRIDEKKLRKLENEAGRLEETRGSLFSSLHRMLDAKIEVARKRLEKREAVLHTNAEAVKEWQSKVEELKEVSKEKVKEKHAVKAALMEAEAEVAKAKEREAELRRKLERKSTEVGEKVQRFQYAEARYQAQVAHEKQAKEAALAAKESLNELTHTFDAESHKVEESVDIRKIQLGRKMHAIEEDKEKSAEQLATLKGEFNEWRQDVSKEKAEIAKKRREQDMASEEAAEHKRQLRKTTHFHMPEHITRGVSVDNGDWDSWGSSATSGAEDSD
jgi:chromosome segregation ATPase